MMILLFMPVSVGAQDSLTIESLEVDLWPEYDSPEVLVIYRIVLSPEVILPVDLSIQIPAAAGEPNAVAVRDPNGTLLNAPYERQVNGDWASIRLTASMPGIQIEYYDPQLIKNDGERNFEFTWIGDYAIKTFSVQFQQPFGANQVVTVPGASTTSVGSDGLTYHLIELGAIPATSLTSISVRYFKDSEALSIEGFQVQPSAPLSQSTSGRVTIMNLLPWILGGVGVLLVFGGIWWYWQTGREKNKQPKRRSRGQRSPGYPKPKQDNTSEITDNEGVYCHQCGKRAETRDRFCRSCGSKLRAT